MDYSATLTAAGWAHKGGCRCGGVKKEKWARSLDKMVIYPTRNRFILKRHGQAAITGDLVNIAASL